MNAGSIYNRCYVISDEAGHVAFGVLCLKEFDADLSCEKIVSRQGVRLPGSARIFEPILRPRSVGTDGADPRAVVTFMVQNHNPDDDIFRFTEIGVIQFEDWVDTSQDYGSLDAVAAVS